MNNGVKKKGNGGVILASILIILAGAGIGAGLGLYVKHVNDGLDETAEALERSKQSLMRAVEKKEAREEEDEDEESKTGEEVE
ncbi:hypothetical protein IKF15_02575 [Candidatus Saccharibacteria bacterium]|nr:hypothetical protein [Candidatus Saccharibacteria bacterium]